MSSDYSKRLSDRYSKGVLPLEPSNPRILEPSSLTMCLAIPLRLVSVNGTDAVGEVGGIQREVSIMMTPDAKVGDYVIVHAGFAIQVLDQKEAEENLELLRQIGEAAEQKQEEVRRRRRPA